MNNLQPNNRKMIILVSLMDAILSGIVVLSYFGLIPFDLAASFGIQRWVVGLCGGLWFLVSIGILGYQLSKVQDQTLE